MKKPKAGIFDVLAEVQTGRDGYFVAAALQFQSDRDVGM